MNSLVYRLLAAASRYLALWVVVAALAAYFVPESFAWTERPLRHFFGASAVSAPEPAPSPYDLLGQRVFQWLFALTMFAVGTVIETRAFTTLFARPLPVLQGLLTQFTMMPCLAWLTAKAGGFDDATALGFIIVGCAPGAMTSNLLTYLARGDTAYSVTLTTLASILAVVITPSLIWLLAGEELGMSADRFRLQLWTITWTVATPLILGLALRRLTPGASGVYTRLSPAVASVAIVAICGFVIRSTREHLTLASAAVLVGVVIVNALGFLVGWSLGRVWHLERPRRITLSIEVGMQNAGMGVVLATSTFADRKGVAVPAAFFAIWCILTATALIAFFERRARGVSSP